MISVLVPVYRVESYLQRCIDSVVTQDFQDWEMILVDDGSPDRCPEICDEAAKKDPRISVVHKDNGGLPSARLAGFEHARGEYLFFLDSDDWLLDGALKSLYRYTNDGIYDIIKARNRRVLPSGEFTVEGEDVMRDVKGNLDCLQNFITLGFSPYLWGALYRKSLFNDNIFNKVIDFSIGEDWLTNIAVALNVNRVLCVPDVVYNYYINSSSFMQTKICSHNYGIRMNKYLDEIFHDCPKRIEVLIQYNKTLRCISESFIPELPYYKENFKTIERNIKEPIIMNLLKEKLDKKFLYFINIPILYVIYSRIYRILYFYIKLKGKKRSILN